MAKEVIFIVSWLRPLKLIGLCNLLCGIIAFILCMILEDWVLSDESDTHQYYMSLWTRCLKIPPNTQNLQQNATTTAATTTTTTPEGEDFKCKDSRVLGGKVLAVNGSGGPAR